MSNNSNSIHLKKEILIRLAKAFFSDDFEENTRLIPFDMRPKGSEVPFRCCIHKERAILKDRAIAGLGFSIEEDDERKSLKDYAKEALEREKPEEKPLTVLDDACKGCVSNRVYITDLCQGCVARPCQSACKFGAISIVNGKSVIDSSKCRNCKMCIPSCPYNAIVKITVPCEEACPVSAISKNEFGSTKIDFEKCISCGRCVSVCPFGAVHEKSQMIDILKNIKEGKKVIAMIAPSIVGQFPGTIYQLKTAIVKAGFFDVYEVAQGADTTTKNEALEFQERMAENAPFMTTSCCAAYNNLVEKHLNEIKPFVSNTKTPLYYIAQYVKEKYPDCISVFVSPCVAKRTEGMGDKNVDYVMNFEELGALFVAKKIEILECEETQFENESSKQGRNFGVTKGVAGAVSFLAKDVKPCYIDGLNKETIKELKTYAKDNLCPGNLVEVMGCPGGCVGGNAAINKSKIAAKKIGEFAQESKDIKEDNNA
jgi:[FeFe] hydrogenase (group B1/B3)